MIRHIVHYLDIGLENNICFGSDFDGTDLPHGINGIDDIYKVYEAAASAGIDETTLEKLFFGNAYAFFEKYL